MKRLQKYRSWCSTVHVCNSFCYNIFHSSGTRFQTSVTLGTSKLLIKFSPNLFLCFFLVAKASDKIVCTCQDLHVLWLELPYKLNDCTKRGRGTPAEAAIGQLRWGQLRWGPFVHFFAGLIRRPYCSYFCKLFSLMTSVKSLAAWKTTNS